MDAKRLQPTIDLIKEFEGFESDVYLCPADYCTIGYGHVIRSKETGRMLKGEDEMDEARLQYPSGVTKERALEMLEKYVASLAPRVACMVSAHLTDNQFCALLDLAYNIGDGEFETSTVRKRVNAGQFDLVPAALRMWNKKKDKKTGQKVVSPGLARRREAEIALWHKEE